MSAPRESEARAAHAAALRLRAHYLRASLETVETGRRWYPAARSIARDIGATLPAGMGERTAAKVIAALSPQLRWSLNVREARAMAAAAARMHGDPIFGDLGAYGAAYAAGRFSFPDARALAARLLSGERVHVSGPKRGAFWRAICGDAQAVTVDIWAARAAGYRPDRLTARRLRIITSAYRRAARMVGETPRDLQAIVWLQVRGTSPTAALAEMTAA